MKKICVFCGSRFGNNSRYRAAASDLGKLLAEKDLTLVYGGGNVGLMGEIANTVLAQGGRATGVIPRFLVEKEVVHEKLSEVRIVESMHERKALMAELADGFIAMPGGFGTLEETVEVLTWAQLGLHKKPIGLLNVDRYFNALYEFFEHMVTENFLHSEHKEMILVKDNPAEMLDSLAGYRLPDINKWDDLQKT